MRKGDAGMRKGNAEVGRGTGAREWDAEVGRGSDAEAESVSGVGGCCTLVPVALHGCLVVTALFVVAGAQQLFVVAALQQLAHRSDAGFLHQQRLAQQRRLALRGVELSLLQQHRLVQPRHEGQVAAQLFDGGQLAWFGGVLALVVQPVGGQLVGLRAQPAHSFFGLQQLGHGLVALVLGVFEQGVHGR